MILNNILYAKYYLITKESFGVFNESRQM